MWVYPSSRGSPPGCAAPLATIRNSGPTRDTTTRGARAYWAVNHVRAASSVPPSAYRSRNPTRPRGGRYSASALNSASRSAMGSGGRKSRNADNAATTHHANSPANAALRATRPRRTSTVRPKPDSPGRGSNRCPNLVTVVRQLFPGFTDTDTGYWPGEPVGPLLSLTKMAVLPLQIAAGKCQDREAVRRSSRSVLNGCAQSQFESAHHGVTSSQVLVDDGRRLCSTGRSEDRSVPRLRRRIHSQHDSAAALPAAVGHYDGYELLP